MISGRFKQQHTNGSRWSPRTLLLIALVTGMPGGCSTEDPRENYRPLRPDQTPTVSTFGGSSTSGAGTGGSASGLGGSAASGGSGPSSAGGAAGESSSSSETSGSGGTGGSGGGTGATGGITFDCGPPPVSEAAFTKRALRAAAAECAQHHYCEFEARARVLEAAVAKYAGESSADNLELAREAWREAMSRWQILELFQFGPLASPAMAAGKDSWNGQGRRDKIYAWPTTARCRVDEQVLGRAYVDHGMDSALISGRGLYALESLLFYSGMDTACVPTSATAKAWAALDATTLGEYRLDYAVAVSEDVVDQIAGVIEAWSASGGNFEQSFVTASAYPSEQEAMNVLGWALVYIEKEVKDYKLGIPAGYTLMAPVSEPEAPYAGVASHNIASNLLGFRSLFMGCGPRGEGLGFDDWLIEAGHQELAEDIVSAWQSAYRAAEGLPPLHEASRAEAELAYLAIKTLTDLLKNELLGTGSPINLDLPATVAGDTD